MQPTLERLIEMERLRREIEAPLTSHDRRVEALRELACLLGLVRPRDVRLELLEALEQLEAILRKWHAAARPGRK
jgi:hypothetical protein